MSGADRMTISCATPQIRDKWIEAIQELNYEYLMSGMPPLHPQQRHSHRPCSETRSSATSFDSRHTGLTSNESHSSHSSRSPDTRHMSMRSTLSDSSDGRQPSFRSVHSESSDDAAVATLRRPRASSCRITTTQNPKPVMLTLAQHASDNNLRHSLFARLSRSIILLR